jgi:hypothetical protein
MGVNYFNLLTLNYETVYSPLNFPKPVKLHPKRFWTVVATVTVVLSFSFLFISAESLKNHSKSQKNHKIENLILLDSTLVDLHSEYIIWYDLIQIFALHFNLFFL